MCLPERSDGDGLKLLTLKFGPLPDSFLATLDAATAPELEQWAERVLTATTLDEVLGD